MNSRANIQSMMKRTPKTVAIHPVGIEPSMSLKIFKGIEKARFIAMIVVEQKHPVRFKDIEALEAIYLKTVRFCQHDFHVKRLILSVPVTPFARKALRLRNWELIEPKRDTMAAKKSPREYIRVL